MAESIFTPFPKIARLSRECVITEKIDGTNASVTVTEAGDVIAASRTRWITPTSDNHGFAKWVESNRDELLKLGPGLHFGEWWGPGIQRGYGLVCKKFSLFNVSKWEDPDTRPSCCDVVPVIKRGLFRTELVDEAMEFLEKNGSIVSPGFMRPEGIVIFHASSGHLYKKTFVGDQEGKHGA